jgi:hypothetical protein
VAALPADPADPAEPAAVVVVPVPDLEPLPVPELLPDPLLFVALAAASWAEVSRAPQAVHTSVTANRTTTLDRVRHPRRPLFDWIETRELDLAVIHPPPGEEIYLRSGPPNRQEQPGRGSGVRKFRPVAPQHQNPQAEPRLPSLFDGRSAPLHRTATRSAFL